MTADASPPTDARPRRPQFNLRVLMIVMTIFCVAVALTVQLENPVPLLIPASLLVLLLVRNRWALVVVALYGAILFTMIGPLIAVAFLRWPDDFWQLYGTWPFWAWFDLMVIGQAALLIVPVARVERRPVRRVTLAKPLLASGFLVGLMVLAAVASIHEFFTRQALGDGVKYGLLAGLAAWIFWAVLFGLASRNRDPHAVVAAQCRFLFAGSILELLIAVPTHVVARHRDYCCAGLMTFLGLTFGTAVMLFSFGPAVFFLFVDRWKRKHPPTDA